jgi:stage V sporulation protein SpoVS
MQKEATMTLRRITGIGLVLFSALLLLAFASASGNSNANPAISASDNVDHNCVPVGGMIMTNLGGFGPNTTLGTVTGDLRGAVGVNIVSISPGAGNTTLFAVQHHWVTESGDTLSLDPATATTTQVAPGLFAIVNYPVHLSGGTGKFAGATGDLSSIGEVDSNAGQLVLRYRGQVCFPEPGNH